MIEVKNLSRHFGHIAAVENVSFTVQKGDVLGFLGPNGAGKSTTMRMITGYIPPTSGTAIIGGFDICEEPLKAREKIGYLSETVPVYHDMSVTGFLKFCGEIRGFYGKENKKKVSEIIEKCFLKEVVNQNIGTLSKGYRQRVCFAQSIIHDPEYLILDEPTDGLDPNQKHVVRQMIREMSGTKAIILSTHILEEMDAVCNRAVLISKGRIVVDETPDELRSRSVLHNSITMEIEASDVEKAMGAMEKIEGVKEVQILERMPDSTTVRVHPSDRSKSISVDVSHAMAHMGVSLLSFHVEHGRLNEVFRQLTSN
ncbi:ABC transporter ATP-binding protein [Desulforegula conservatrix]|uniref:ABC transporter ATP-binding protein n=1 Tax=Desulforegula conservatrix TaxID=153026 RepID=UPI00041D220F|nr:ATP-binding cassette domain-containing protein [Desulforegula conservatrix]